MALPDEVHFCQITHPPGYTVQIVFGLGLRPISSLRVVNGLALTSFGGKSAKCVGSESSLAEADPAAATARANTSPKATRPVVLQARLRLVLPVTCAHDPTLRLTFCIGRGLRPRSS